MKSDPQRHPFDQAPPAGTSQGKHRRSIRLQGYDYSQSGAYFVTMVTFRRECLFGEIQNERMRLSDMGQIADENWRAIPEHFPQVELGAYMVMPNHVHGIIIIQPVGAQYIAPLQTQPPHVKPGSVGSIIRTYKAAVTRRIQKELNGGNIWQRNYYEHIIRNDEEHNRIHLYIESNIDNWEDDDENPGKRS